MGNTDLGDKPAFPGNAIGPDGPLIYNVPPETEQYELEKLTVLLSKQDKQPIITTCEMEIIGPPQGMTYREWLAGKNMAGFAWRDYVHKDGTTPVENCLAKVAIKWANALIRELEQDND